MKRLVFRSFVTHLFVFFRGSPKNGPCEVLGRQCLKFRSCACPKRDKDNNERRIAQDLGESGLTGSGMPNPKRRREHGKSQVLLPISE